MFREIFFFELYYRRKRSATYIYFGLIFLVCFLTAASPTRQSTGATWANAPYIIAEISGLMSLVFTMITSAIMGVSIIRDFEHNTDTMVFTTPLKKGDYLMGRFAGSLVILILINCAVWLGLMAGFSLGKFLPWEIAWVDDGILPFNAWHYWQPFFTITLTNLFVTGSLYFMSGALGRSSMVIYTQGIVLLVFYQIGFTLIGNIDSKPWAALFDPFGIHTIQHVTRYWTPAERNSMVIPMEGIMLYNRLVWIGIGIIALLITQFTFSFNPQRSPFREEKNRNAQEPFIKYNLLEIPLVKRAEGTWMHVTQILHTSLMYVRMIRKDVPFLAMIITGILLIVFNALKMTEIYGSSSYPTTFSVLRVLGSFNLVFIIISIFYSGELIWKERTVQFAPITDALPVPSFTGLVAKFIALTIIYIALLVGLMVVAFLIQAAYGYFEYNFTVYAGTLFSSIFIGAVLFTLFSFFIQVLVNNKFLGFSLCISLLLINGLFNRMGLEHDLWRFASGTLGIFSDMNHYGHFVSPFVWFKMYWLGFSMLLFSIAVVFSVRGSESSMVLRWQVGKLRLTRSLIIFSLFSASLFLLSGSYIYYNTSMLNEFEPASRVQAKRARYERLFKQYEFLPQPKIVETNIKLDLYPLQRDFDAEGFYYLKNKANQAIEQVHIQHNTDPNLKTTKISFDRPAKPREENSEFRYAIYALKQPLLPGDSLKMSFELRFRTTGFKAVGSNTDLVYNGTFLNNLYFPSLGYNDNYELQDNSSRKKQGLKVTDHMRVLNDTLGRAINTLSEDADHIRFEMTVSTEKDQTAIAPGLLQKKWQDGERNYFHYKMIGAMGNFYSVVSARYAVKRDQWNNVKLEIYYHPDHEFNISRMMEAMKESLDYYSSNFSPFQYAQLRIMEFPRYREFAQSFANTIPFSEGIGFIFKAVDPTRDVDMAYYITAHEVAHQWWGHQVMAAKVQGSGMLSEGMAQYSALMVLKHQFPREVIGQYLKYELDSYLAGRGAEKKSEYPLNKTDGQNYIHYNKASLIFYALQDYIGEDNVNKAFRNYNEKWSLQEGYYPSSADLLQELREVTPDSLQYLIRDMFETITLFENKTVEAVYENKPNGGYAVTIKTESEKMRADSVGSETGIVLNDWIDIGIYSKDRLIYFKKHLITKKENTFTISVMEKPTAAGIDPLHKLIDRHSNDNTINVRRLVEISNLPLE